MLRKYKILFLLLTAFVQSFAQVDVKKTFAKAESAFNAANYAEALPLYLKLDSLEKGNANFNFKIGICYINSYVEKDKALSFLEMAATNVSEKYKENTLAEKQAPVIVYNYLGRAYHFDYQFTKAIEAYEKLKSFMTISDKEMITDINRQIEVCRYGIDLMANAKKIKVENLGPAINSAYPDYSAVLNADETTIMFTSRRPNTTGGKIDLKDNMYFEDIYISNKKESVSDGQQATQWYPTTNIGSPINTESNDATIGLSVDGQKLLIYRDDKGDGNIYFSTQNGSSWSVPEKLNEFIDSKSWEPSASISADGAILYFTSEREGGFGGRDIYKSNKLPNGEWAKPRNLGPAINTAYDEDGPFIHPDGVTLYFSSKGHKGMGGFDIFYSTLSDTGTWDVPVNIGYPINSTDDDIFYVASADGKRAYYSSIKKGGFGDKDIYLISLDTVVVDPVVLLKGVISFNGTNVVPLGGVKINVTDVETGIVMQEYKVNVKTGKYLMTLSPGPNGKAYVISYEADGYKPITETIKLDKGYSYQEIEKPVDLRIVNFEPIKPGLVNFSGTITSTEGAVITTAKVTVKDNNTGGLVGAYSGNELGQYSFSIEKDQNYNIAYEADGYLFRSENVIVAKADGASEVKRDIMLDRIKVGSKIVLNNIFFDNAKATLRKESTPELEKLFTFLNTNPDIRVEISGHTDSKGKDAANLKLSQERAEAVVSYLLKKGVDKKRLIAKGYGKAQPIATNILDNGKPNKEGMQLNRRVEMKILGNE